MKIIVQVESEIIDMELDTDSAISAISLIFYHNKFNHITIEYTNVKLRENSGTSIIPGGLIKINVKLNKKNIKITFVCY